MLFAWYDAEHKLFLFPDKSVAIDQFDDTYVVEARLFRSDEEILIQKRGSGYVGRKVIDEAAESSQKREYVDSKSPMFGVVSRTIPCTSKTHSFVYLVDKGRGFCHNIPVFSTEVKQEGKNYYLKTRSYISYDKDTGQAGYDMYRYVEIDRDR